MTNPLSPLKYGKVVGRLLAGIIDSPDVGVIPDFPPLEGRVTFTANVPKYLVPLADPPATVAPLTNPYYTCTLDDEGYLTWRGKRGVYLAAPVSGTMNPSGWTWTVSFDLTYLGTPVPIAPFAINVPEYIPGPDPDDPDEGSVGLVDLALASPVPSSSGNAVVRGLSVVSVGLDGTALVFGLDDGTFLDPVEVPAIQDAQDAADAAAASATAADASAAAAAAAVNSFDLDIGTVTTGAAGSSASASVGGGPPAWTLNLTIPRGDTGATGPAAPDATSTVKGIVKLTNDFGGTADLPTVANGAITTAKLADTSVTVAKLGSDVTPAMESLIDNRPSVTSKAQIAGILGGTPSSPAFSAAAFGTSSTTACVGNDARLSDNRTPTTGTVPYDLSIVAFSKSSTRATGTGDFPFGVKLQRAATFSSVTYRANTADASGNLVAELRKNGSAVAGTSTTIAAANQVTGGTSTGSWAFAAGDILTVQITGVGTTPGTGLIADIKGLA